MDKIENTNLPWSICTKRALDLEHKEKPARKLPVKRHLTVCCIQLETTETLTETPPDASVSEMRNKIIATSQIMKIAFSVLFNI